MELNSRNGEVSKESYYKELHATARSFNTQMWAIPGVSFGITAVIFGAIFSGDSTLNSLGHGIAFLANAFISLIFLFQFAKTYLRGKLIQNEIRKLHPEEKVRSVYSGDLGFWICEWERDNHCRRIGWIYKFSARRVVSRFVNFAMLVIIIGSFILGINSIFCFLGTKAICWL